MKNIEINKILEFYPDGAIITLFISKDEVKLLTTEQINVQRGD